MDFVDPADHRVKIKESKKIDKLLNLGRELKKAMEKESNGDTTSSKHTWNQATN